MESILRGAATYLLVWLIFRITGKRTLAQITTFDAVLLLIISETTQAALTDNDNSFTNSILLILTMLGIDVLLSCIKQRLPVVEKVMDDILHAARELHGLGRLDQIEYAILEQTGEITIVPKPAQ